MPVYAEEDVQGLSEEYKKKMCEWCFYHDFGNCGYCVLKGIHKPKETPND